MTTGATDIDGPDEGVLLLDASCLLNLYATGRIADIAAALPWQLAVVDYVLEHETLYIRATGGYEESGATVPVDLSPLIEAGLLLVLGLEEPGEQAHFVELAADLDDGEAMTGAMAINRSFAVAIDDRKARRVLGEKAPELRLLSTLELLHLWSAAVLDEEVGRALRAMRHGARYAPGQRDRLYSWWLDQMERSIADEP